MRILKGVTLPPPHGERARERVSPTSIVWMYLDSLPNLASGLGGTARTVPLDNLLPIHKRLRFW